MYSNRSKENDLSYGLKCEPTTKILIEKTFKTKLTHSLFKYSLFDFYDDKRTYIYEVKNYKYPYEQYRTEIIGANKGISEHDIFVFRHEDDDKKAYFIQYNKELFDTFNTRFIRVNYRPNAVLCYDIPKIHLTHIEEGKEYAFKKVKGEKSVIKSLLEKDKNEYDRFIELNMV
jgi:hypothetical protein